MTSKRRLQTLEKDLQLAEAAYRQQLIKALHTCAAGQWGLFGTNDTVHQIHFRTKDHVQSSDARMLIDAGDEIAELRSHLAYIDTFPLHERFTAYRKLATEPSASGEPRLAQQFLNEIERGLC